MKKELTSQEFDKALRCLPRPMKSRNIQIARAILVEGYRQSEMIRETGLSRTAVAAFLRKIREVHKQYGLPPSGWERVEVCVPSNMVHLVRALETEARRQHDRED